MWNSLIQEFMLYEFTSLNWTVMLQKLPKGFVVCETKVDHSTVSRWLKKFCSGCMNLNDQAKSGRPKTMDSESVLQAMKAKSDK